MSMITRCPACHTLFKVVPDQLRISEGWVRCGQCEQIFDATPHLLTLEQELALSNAALEGTEASLSEPGHKNHADAAPEVEPEPEPEPRANFEAEVVSFLRETHRRSYWHRPFARVALGFVGLALLLGLSVQIVFHERNRMAALEPSLEPWLLLFCRPFNCTLSPLRRIESIVIESASFTKIQANSYRLNFTVKNTAGIALATPAIELALTDTLDQPIVRRVFLPAELGVKSDTLAPGSEWPASLAVAVKAAGIADRVAGYRLLVFYP
jgi:predicted Zn finger-like uncharacterized protein